MDRNTMEKLIHKKMRRARIVKKRTTFKISTLITTSCCKTTAIWALRGSCKSILIITMTAGISSLRLRGRSLKLIGINL